MKKICITWLLISIQICSYSQSIEKSIVIIIDTLIVDGISSELNTLVSDLEFEGYNVIQKNSSNKTPEDIRKYLQDLASFTLPTLKGAILIGKIPLARQYLKMTYTNPDILPTYHNGLSTQFYSDLDGNFYKNNPLYPNSYSDHDGDIYSEIWVSVLPFYKNTSSSITKIKQYLNKNHLYRTGKIANQDGYLEVNEHYDAKTATEYNSLIDFMKTGDYSWKPFTEWGNVGLYIRNSIGKPDINFAYENELNSNKYRFAALIAHGTPSVNGELSIADVRSMTINPNFVWLDGCNTGNIDYDENIATEIVYSNLSKTIVAKGGTSNVGGLGTNEDGFYGKNIATAMLEGKNLGEAYIYHNNTPLIYPWSESFEMNNAVNIFIGDLSLTLFPKPQKLTLFAPEEIEENLILPSTFRWSSSTVSKAYEIQISQYKNFESIVFEDSAVIDTFLSIESLQCPTRYYWRVRGLNPSFKGEWSTVSSFILASSPEFITLSGKITAQNNIECIGETSGFISITGEGGISPYQYSINGGISQDSGTFNNLSVGNYSVVIKDANQCIFNQIVELINDDSIPPSFIELPNDTLVCCRGDIPIKNEITATDNCDNFYIHFDEVITDSINANIFKLVRTWTATDGIGNSSFFSQVITVKDTISPKLECPPDIIVNGNINITNEYENIDNFLKAGGAISDNCLLDSLSFGLMSDYMDTSLLPAVLNRSYYIADKCSNEKTCLQKIIIENATYSENVESTDKINCTVFPNPNLGLFTITITGITKNKIYLEIFNSQSNIISKKEYTTLNNSLTENIDLSNLSKGVYCIKITDGQTITNSSIIIN